MNRRVLVVIVCVFAFLGLTGWVAVRLLAQLQPATAATRAVVFAAHDVPEGAQLQARDLVVLQVPIELVPPGAALSPDSVIHRVTRQPLFRREAIVAARLAAAGHEPGLEVKIAAGKRAMAIPIDEVIGLSGLIQPNSRVDVLVTLPDVRSNGDAKQTKLFMSNMRVLSVGAQLARDLEAQGTPSRTATLEVTPGEAERLAIATQQGRIQLVLRGYGDPDTVMTNGASSADLIAFSSAPVPSAAAARPERAPAATRPRRALPTEPVPPVPAPPAPPRTPEAGTIQVFRGPSVTPSRAPQTPPDRP